MEGIMLFIVAAILLNLAASRWGADSREGVDSHEWERRRAWSRR